MYLPSAILLGFFAANGLAMPHHGLKVRDDGVTYTNDPNGNTIISFSDDTINLGTVTVQDVFDKLYGLCLESGQCDTRQTSISGDYASTNVVDAETITLTAAGDYPIPLHNGLLGALQAAVNSVATIVPIDEVDRCYYPPSECPPPVTRHYDQVVVPAFWGIQLKDNNDPGAAPPYINLGLTQQINTGSGFCSTYATIGSAVAGAVNGGAGGIFTLFGLVCQAM